MTYSSVNDTYADLANVATSWQGPVNDSNGSFLFEINSTGLMITVFKPFNGSLDRCLISGSFTPVQNENMYTITNMELTDCTNSNVNGTNYSGLATTISLDNGVMPIAFSNGSFSGTGEIPLD